MEDKKIVILDFGSQTTQLIARKIRELGVRAEIFAFNTPAQTIKEQNAIGLIFSGSPYFPWQEGAPHPDPAVFDLDIPILGLCYGLYLMAEKLGGEVKALQNKEYGKATLDIVSSSDLLQNIPPQSIVWMNHGGEAIVSQELVEILASSENTKAAAFKAHSHQWYALQFHPEVMHTEFGKEMLSNFIFKICQAQTNWSLENWIEQEINRIKDTVKNGKALCAISGGVDSTTAALLVNKAIGQNLTCVFVDTGLMRLNEPEEVEHSLKDLGLNLKVVSAKDRFLEALKCVTDPEEKRKIIGNLYIRIFEEEAAKVGKIDFLVQGTIYSDRIESQKAQSQGLASKIKTHHNVGGLPEDMKFQLVEPLAELFKDEVRQVARSLGLPESIAGRHPFPGPGLAIQIMGEVTEEKLNITKQADGIAVEEIRKAGLYNQIGEVFANFTGVRTSGVKGDERVYQWLIAIRCVDPSDLMTSSWTRLPYDVLATISTRIVNEIKDVNRVVYDITNKPPGTIRWE